jgi:tRNA (guanine-N7-)-methyltransferase
MRQKKPKNLYEKLDAHSGLLATAGEPCRGLWRGRFVERLGEWPGEAEGRRLYLEIGCGKGGFLLAKAAGDLGAFYIGVEGRDGVILRALEKVDAIGLKNALFLRMAFEDASEIFASGELDGIFLNFSDPWPKERHKARRLTHGKRVSQYGEALKLGGFLEFKTDNEDFFRYSMGEFNRSGKFRLVQTSEDLHGGEALPANFAMSEYEEKFVRWGKRIFFFRAET